MDWAELLERLDALIERLPARVFFNPPATEGDIADVEAAIGRLLPGTYKQFLLRYDGGFISREPISAEDKVAVAAEQWNANHLRGCEDIIREYADALLLERDFRPDVTDWPYVPFCQTEGQETLVFGPPGLDGLHPVLDAFHEVGAEEWGVLAKCFSDFLVLYIDGSGFPAMIASPKDGVPSPQGP